MIKLKSHSKFPKWRLSVHVWFDTTSFWFQTLERKQRQTAVLTHQIVVVVGRSPTRGQWRRDASKTRGPRRRTGRCPCPHPPSRARHHDEPRCGDLYQLSSNERYTMDSSAMDSFTIYQAPPQAAYCLWSCDKVYHKQEINVLLYFLGQIISWQYNPNLLD